MRVDNVQGVNFQSRKRAGIVVSDLMKNDVQRLLYNMNHETRYEQSTNGNFFKSYILGALKIENKALFIDKRFLCAPTEKYRNLCQADCSIEFGYNKLEINSQTGDVFASKKPFWRSLKRVVSKGHEFVQKALENYDNSAFVDKRTIGICGVTEKGAKILDNAKQKAKIG